MRAYERLLKYVAVHTQSDPNSTTVPTSECQFDLAHLLVDEMKAMGIADAHVDEHCYVYGHIPATAGCESAPKLGFIAHMDTSPDFSGLNVNPVIIENYDGEDVVLGSSDKVLSKSIFKHLPTLKSRTLITTDGTTLLGADDKAGVAEILTMAERLIAENIPHGPICIGFTPDEEVGTGAATFDLETFDADYAYTLDGSVEGEIQYENFTASSADFVIKGFSVHPGTSKDTMINASLVACEINSMLPTYETPSHTEGYEGFYHLMSIKGDVVSAELHYIVRDFTDELMEARKNTLRLIAKSINEKYGEDTVVLTLKDQYKNMRSHIEGMDCLHLVENAVTACKAVGITPIVQPIRGGTDGAQLTYKGLPCPNLGTGGFSFHGPYEHITVEAMDLSTDMIVELIKLYSK
ncbi:MAG: peptidase T [Eubacteriales bacterium]